MQGGLGVQATSNLHSVKLALPLVGITENTTQISWRECVLYANHYRWYRDTLVTPELKYMLNKRYIHANISERHIALTSEKI